MNSQKSNWSCQCKRCWNILHQCFVFHVWFMLMLSLEFISIFWNPQNKTNKNWNTKPSHHKFWKLILNMTSNLHWAVNTVEGMEFCLPQLMKFMMSSFTVLLYFIIYMTMYKTWAHATAQNKPEFVANYLLTTISNCFRSTS